MSRQRAARQLVRELANELACAALNVEQAAKLAAKTLQAGRFNQPTEAEQNEASFIVRGGIESLRELVTRLEAASAEAVRS